MKRIEAYIAAQPPLPQHPLPPIKATWFGLQTIILRADRYDAYESDVFRQLVEAIGGKPVPENAPLFPSGRTVAKDVDMLYFDTAEKISNAFNASPNAIHLSLERCFGVLDNQGVYVYAHQHGNAVCTTGRVLLGVVCLKCRLQTGEKAQKLAHGIDELCREFIIPTNKIMTVVSDTDDINTHLIPILVQNARFPRIRHHSSFITSHAHILNDAVRALLGEFVVAKGGVPNEDSEDDDSDLEEHEHSQPNNTPDHDHSRHLISDVYKFARSVRPHARNHKLWVDAHKRYDKLVKSDEASSIAKREIAITKRVFKRWDAIYAMLDTFLALRWHVDDVTKRAAGMHCFSDDQYALAKAIASLLSPFIDCASQLQSFPYYSLADCANMARALREFFAKEKTRWEKKSLAYKDVILRAIDNCVSVLDRHYSPAKTQLHACALLLHPQYRTNHTMASKFPAVDIAAGETYLRTLYDGYLSMDDINGYRSSWEEMLRDEERKEHVLDELDVRDDSLQRFQIIDAVEYRRKVSDRVPRFSQMATDVLSIPHSSADVDRVYSLRGIALRKHCPMACSRTRTLLSLAEWLLCGATSGDVYETLKEKKARLIQRKRAHGE